MMNRRIFAALLAITLACFITGASALTYDGVVMPFTGGFSLTLPSQWITNTLTDEDSAAGVVLFTQSEDESVKLTVNQFASENFTLDDMLFQLRNNDLIAATQITARNGLSTLEYEMLSEEDVFNKGIVLCCQDGFFYEITLQYIGEANASIAEEILGTLALITPES